MSVGVDFVCFYLHLRFTLLCGLPIFTLTFISNGKNTMVKFNCEKASKDQINELMVQPGLNYNLLTVLGVCVIKLVCLNDNYGVFLT